MKNILISVMIVGFIMFTGCELVDEIFSNLPPDETPSENIIDDMADEIDLSTVIWHHADVSGWEKTSDLNISFSGNGITYDYDKAGVWPGKAIPSSTPGTMGNGNVWIFVQFNGVWHGATWEWLKVNQTTKTKANCNYTHIKTTPFTSENWYPTKGMQYGGMVSGLARTSLRNVEERTPVKLFIWK